MGVPSLRVGALCFPSGATYVQALESTGDLGLQLKGLPRGLDAAGAEAGGEAFEKVISTACKLMRMPLVGVVCCTEDERIFGVWIVSGCFMYEVLSCSNKGTHMYVHQSPFRSLTQYVGISLSRLR